MTLISLDVSEITAMGRDMVRNAELVEPKVDKLVKRTGYKVVSRMQANTPVDTGTLRASEGVDFGNLSFEAGPTAEHGVYVELGTSRMNPQPFVGPSFDAELSTFERSLGDIGERIL